MPVYNVEKYLQECLDSIINQSFKDFEIICVNDGSTDKSLQILEEYAKKDSRFIVMSQQNLGAGEARNTGLKNASGKYVQFLDSDDYFEPNMLEELYNTAEKFSTDIVVCSAKRIDEDGNIVQNVNPSAHINFKCCPLNTPFSKDDYPDKIFSFYNAAPWNKLYLREMLIKYSLKFQNLSSCNDIGFVRTADASAKRIIVIDKDLIRYRFNRNGSIAKIRASNTINFLKAKDFIKDFLIKNNMYEQLKEALIESFKAFARWELSLCNDEQYAKFITEVKEQRPDDFEKLRPILRRTYITPDYIKNFIGDKKVMLWGASLFLEGVLKNEEEKNRNILGIIDINSDRHGKYLGHYKIFPPESLKIIKPKGILLTIFNDYEKYYSELKQELEEKYPEIELLPNIFEAENL